MKWEQDLVRDIRFHDDRDDIDDPRLLGHVFPDIPQEFSKCNAYNLGRIIGTFSVYSFGTLCPKNILEIGVHRNGEKSSTKLIHDIIKHSITQDSIYLGVDLEDKSYLCSDNDLYGSKIHTIQCNSSNYDLVVDKMEEIGMKEIDLLFIDGWHSINQVLDDWEYTKLLSKKSVVFFHDTSAHPGPKLFLENLDRKKWDVSENLCPDDYGLGMCYAKA